MRTKSTPLVSQLKRALKLAEQIEELQSELGAILKQHPQLGAVTAGVSAAGPKKRRKRRKMSAEAREKIAAAQRARWAKARRAKAS